MPDTRAAALVATGLLLGACAVPAPKPATLSFAMLGDTPYSTHEEPHYRRMLKRIDEAQVDFVVHVGDFKGPQACSDALFERRRAEFDAWPHPFAYVPGD